MTRKKHIEIDDSSLFDKILNETPLDRTILYQMSLNVSNQIQDILERKRMRQKDLASLLGKTEAEVSKWLSGLHNFTFKTVAKIQSVLGEKIIMTPNQIKQEIEENLSILLDKHFHRTYSEMIFKVEKDRKMQAKVNVTENVKIANHAKVLVDATAKVVEMKHFSASILTKSEIQLEPTGT